MDIATQVSKHNGISSKTLTAGIVMGGSSSRMGTDKYNLELHGKTFLERTIQALQTITQNIVLNTSRRTPEAFSYPVVKDQYVDIGPLAGIHALLQNSNTPFVVVISCDLPLLSSLHIDYLISKANSVNGQAYVFRNPSGHIPLLAVFRTSVVSAIESQIESGQYAFREALAQLDTVYIDMPEELAFGVKNINTQQDYQNLEKNKEITVRYFGQIEEYIGTSRHQLYIPNSFDLTALKKLLQTVYPKLSDLSYSMAVDQKMITNTNTKRIQSVKEVALFPPFSGG